MCCSRVERLLGRAECHDREDRSEDFLAGDTVARGHAGKKTGSEPESLGGQLAVRLRQLRSFRHAALDEFADAAKLFARIDRADVGILVERIADTQQCATGARVSASQFSPTPSCTSSRDPAQQTCPWLK